MKCLFVIDSLGSGGAQRQFVAIACGLKSLGHHIEVFTYQDFDFFKKKLEASDIGYHCVQKKSRWSVRPIFQIRSIVRRARFDAILSFLDTPNVYCELALLGLGDIGLVVSERSSSVLIKPSFLKKLLTQFHRRADFVTSNSSYHTKWLLTNFPWLSPRLETIYNGVELADFSAARKPTPGQKLRLLGIGRITAAKNIPRLVAALAHCRNEAAIDVSIDWCGRVDSPAIKLDVDEKLKELNLTDYWIWLGQIEEIPETMLRYDALILPSLWEGLPNVVCESLAAGLPVLASRVSDMGTLVQDGITGFLFEPTSVDDIANAISRFALTNDIQRHAMSNAGRKFAAQNLTIEQCVLSYEKLLMKVSRMSS